MLKWLKNNHELLLGLCLVAFIVWLMWLVAQGLFGFFSTADSTVQGAIIGGTVALISLGIAYLREREKSIKEAHREKKIEVYNVFNEIVFSAMEMSKQGRAEEITENSELEKSFKKLRRGAIFYGSPKVIKALAEFMSETTDDNPLTPVRRAGRVFLAMRKDIGLSNRGLNDLSIHQIYVTDDLSKME